MNLGQIVSKVILQMQMGDAQTETTLKKSCRIHAISWRVKISQEDEIERFSFEIGTKLKIISECSE